MTSLSRASADSTRRNPVHSTSHRVHASVWFRLKVSDGGSQSRLWTATRRPGGGFTTPFLPAGPAGRTFALP